VPAQPSLALPPVASQPADRSLEYQFRVNGSPTMNGPVAVMVTVGPVEPPLLLELDGCGPPLAEQPARARPATERSARALFRRLAPLIEDMTLFPCSQLMFVYFSSTRNSTRRLRSRSSAVRSGLISGSLLP
jgi:hypothetical protein